MGMTARHPVFVQPLAQRDDLAGHEIEAALVPAASDDTFIGDRALWRSAAGIGRALLKEGKLQVRAGIVERVDLLALLQDDHIETGKFENLALAVDKRIDGDRLVPFLAGNLHGLAFGGLVQPSFGFRLEPRDIVERDAIRRAAQTDADEVRHLHLVLHVLVERFGDEHPRARLLVCSLDAARDD